MGTYVMRRTLQGVLVLFLVSLTIFSLVRSLPGDAILIPAGAVHTLRNTGATDLKILCCCAPPYSHEDTFLV